MARGVYCVGVYGKTATNCEQKGKQTANVLGDYKFQNLLIMRTVALVAACPLLPFIRRRSAKSAIWNVHNRNLCDLLPAANIVSDSFHGSFTFIFPFSLIHVNKHRRTQSAGSNFIFMLCMRGCQYHSLLRGNVCLVSTEHHGTWTRGHSLKVTIRAMEIFQLVGTQYSLARNELTGGREEKN